MIAAASVNWHYLLILIVPSVFVIVLHGADLVFAFTAAARLGRGQPRGSAGRPSGSGGKSSGSGGKSSGSGGKSSGSGGKSSSAKRSGSAKRRRT